MSNRILTVCFPSR